jgi:hypothetical protein
MITVSSPLSLEIPSLASRRIEADNHFINSLLDGFLDCPDSFSSISFWVLSYFFRHLFLLHLPDHHISHGYNHLLHRMLFLPIQLSLCHFLNACYNYLRFLIFIFIFSFSVLFTAIILLFLVLSTDLNI